MLSHPWNQWMKFSINSNNFILSPAEKPNSYDVLLKYQRLQRHRTNRSVQSIKKINYSVLLIHVGTQIKPNIYVTLRVQIWAKFWN